jgi:hypothetical protein
MPVSTYEAATCDWTAADISIRYSTRFLCSTKIKVWVYLKTRTMEDKLINKKIRSHGHILKINKERILKKILKMEIKRKCPRSGWTQQIGKNVRRKNMRQN